jgi:hypothetical protein
MRTRHFQAIKRTKQNQIISLENLASKQRIFQIVKEQHGFMLTVRSKDCSHGPRGPPEQSQHRTRVRFLKISAATRAGGASRDRTGDLLLAKQAFSQLNYGPSIGWWVWEELHPRPHPYQGCALTN